MKLLVTVFDHCRCCCCCCCCCCCEDGGVWERWKNGGACIPVHLKAFCEGWDAHETPLSNPSFTAAGHIFWTKPEPNLSVDSVESPAPLLRGFLLLFGLYETVNRRFDTTPKFKKGLRPVEVWGATVCTKHNRRPVPNAAQLIIYDGRQHDDRGVNECDVREALGVCAMSCAAAWCSHLRHFSPGLRYARWASRSSGLLTFSCFALHANISIIKKHQKQGRGAIIKN